MRFTRELLSGGGILALIGCYGTPAELSEVQISATAAVINFEGEPMLAVNLQAVNTGPSAVTLEWGCHDVLLSAEGESKVAWSLMGPTRGCLDILITTVMAPAEAKDFLFFRYPVALVFAESVKPGRYDVNVRTSFNNLPDRKLHAGTVTLAP